MTLPGDNPIHSPDQDLLGRALLARSFANEVESMDRSEGAVVGVLGPWGSGKTSFMNLVRRELEHDAAVVLDFNPWMFSGAEQLVESFFIELAAQLRLRTGLSDVADGLTDYGEAFSGLGWLPLVGVWIERVRGTAKLLAKLLQRRREGAGERRKRLADRLSQLEHPIIVVLDDIDRLTTPEIRDVFKLVRLTASFPNLVYVLAFDRVRVEQALGEHGISGRDYLEKILQVVLDLPAIPRRLLDKQMIAEINRIVSDIQTAGPVQADAWPDIYAEVIRPLIRNMRDVRRYGLSAHGTLEALGGQIAVVDVLGLEAIRVFLPDVFSHLHEAAEGLTETAGIPLRDDSQPALAVKALVEIAGHNEEVVRAIIARLFPAGDRFIGGSRYGPDWEAQWLRDRRIAHRDILLLYLERVAGESLQAFVDAERAWALSMDRHAFDSYLRALDPARLEDVIAGLETFQGDFASEQVVPGVTVLLNLLPDLPQRQRGMLDFDQRIVVSRVTVRLLRAFDGEQEVADAVERIMPDVTSLSSRFELITDVGYRKGAGHRLVSEDIASKLESIWLDEVRSASVDELLNEWDLLRILYFAQKAAADGGEPIGVADDPRLTLALLQSGIAESRAQGVGSRAVRRAKTLQWGALIAVYRDEAVLKDRLQALTDSPLIAGHEDLIELARKYAEGWRPPEFGAD